MPPSSALFGSELSSMKKSPRQRRSAETVQRIQDALLELIDEEGYAAASTNRIASRAGVNIASLYQYFPNRLAIAMALFERVAAELAQLVHREMLEGMTEPLEIGVPRLIDRLLRFMEKEQAALNLIDEVPELRESAQAMSLENLARDTSRTFLKVHLNDQDSSAINCKLFFVQTASMALVRRYVRDQPADVSRERFVAEISGMIVSYLQAPQKKLADAAAPRRRR